MAYTNSSNFAKKFCKKSPFKTESGFAAWKREWDAKRKWNKENRQIASGKLSVDPNAPHLGYQKTPRGGWG